MSKEGYVVIGLGLLGTMERGYLGDGGGVVSRVPGGFSRILVHISVAPGKITRIAIAATIGSVVVDELHRTLEHLFNHCLLYIKS